MDSLLGTQYTMESSLFKQPFIATYDIEVIIPDELEIQNIHDIIFTELAREKIEKSSQQFLLKVIDILISQGAQAIILGCTELHLLLKQVDVSVPLLDTTSIHALAAVEFMLES